MREYRWTSPFHGRINSGWNTTRMHIGKPLTDAKIKRYQKQGRYAGVWLERAGSKSLAPVAG